MDYLVRFVLGLYPSWWRKRYGKETQEVTEELLADPDTNKVRILGSLLFGATTAWSHIRRRATYLQPVGAGGPPVLPAHSSSPTGRRRAHILGIVVVLMCVALLCAGYVVALRRTFGPDLPFGPNFANSFEGAAARSQAADEIATIDRIPDSALTVALLNQQQLDVKWLSASDSVPKSGKTTYVSISLGGDHVVAAAKFLLACTFGLTVSSASDPIIGQDQLPGVGTYWSVSQGGSQSTSSCSADSAPTSRWEPADRSVLKQIMTSTSG